MKKYNKALAALSATLIATMATPAVAGDSILESNDLTAEAYISAGNSAGSTDWATLLDERTDENVTTSAFTGVVALNPVIDGVSYICSGTVISTRHILTAAHCVDSDGNGNVMDLSQADNSIAIAFNNDGAYYDSGNVGFASDVVIHSDYEGFNICPDGTTGCVNDDVAVITLSEDIPADVEIYDLYTTPVVNTADAGTDGDTFTLVGYGTRGDGYWGYYNQYDDPSVSGDIGELGYATFDEKLTGQNIVDLAFGDDEGTGSSDEIWYADFDGYDSFFDEDIDWMCTNGYACSSTLDESLETTIGGGDSGGPSFIYDALNDKYWLAAINTFGVNTGWAPGAFGDLFGGILLESYIGWIDGVVSATFAASAPSVLVLMVLAIAGMSVRRRMTAA